MNQNVRLQKLWDFTIKICDYNDMTVGTGIIVSTDGKIITCAHVAEAALGIRPREAIGQEIKIYFPQNKKSRTAIIVGCLDNYDDDVVLLQLNDDPASLEPERIAVLGKADGSEGNDFQSYGYAPIGPYISRYAKGSIGGPVEIVLPPDLNLGANPIQLNTDDIRPGLSGGAVLDRKRNLVVGLVTERWNPAGKYEDSNIGWATDNCVLTFDPINLPMRDDPLPMSPASSPNVDFEKAIAAATPKQKHSWNNAPAPFNEWVGRDDSLRAVTNAWIESKTKIISLIGFGGEGKSSLARQWVDNLLKNNSLSMPEGIFWWGFYERPNVDEFFESVLRYMSGENLEFLQKFSSSIARAHFLAAMLYGGRYLLILDGLEKVQLRGNDYGSLASVSMREFLKFLAHPDNKSFCLITSRAPVIDLEEYVTYVHQNISGLSLIEGCSLLEKLGVKGSSKELETVVEEWKGYALALTLIGSCLSDLCSGNISYFNEISKSLDKEDRYDSIHRILNYYDQHLNEMQKDFLTIFSLFRLPVDEVTIRGVFQNISENETLNVVISSLNDDRFNEMLASLKKCKILRYDHEKRHYIMHPLIQRHYSQLLEDEETKFLVIHRRIKDYYLNLTDIPIEPTLEDMKYPIEAIHHACCSNEYDNAWKIYTDHVCPPRKYGSCVRVIENRKHRNFSTFSSKYRNACALSEFIYNSDPRPKYTLTDKLGAYETDLSIMKEFFPNGDLNKEPLVTRLSIVSLILEEVGFCLMSLGNLKEAASFYERANKVFQEIKKWNSLSFGYQNLTRLYIYLGELGLSEDFAHKAEDAAKKRQKCRPKKKTRKSKTDISEEKITRKSLLNSWCLLATIYHMTGDFGQANKYFQKAKTLKSEVNKFNLHLDGIRGIQHADYLRLTGDTQKAWEVARYNMSKINSINQSLPKKSRLYRIFGDLYASESSNKEAENNYSLAIQTARNITRRDILIEALLARGRWLAKQEKIEEAYSDLEEAYKYASESGYQVYRVDIILGLSWVLLAEGNVSKAKERAETAKKMSIKMNYYWGQLEANKVSSSRS